MISCDTSKLEADLKKFHEDVIRRLKGMVVLFAYNVTLSASQHTPVGDFDGNEAYRNFYIKRELAYGIEATPGFHAGAWTFNENNNFQFDPTIYTEEEAAGNVKQMARATYRLGSTFYLGAKGPAFENLDNGYSYKAPDGIMQPTIADIQNVYSLDLAKYYKGIN